MSGNGPLSPPEDSTIDLLWAAVGPNVDVVTMQAACTAGADRDAVAACALMNRVGPLFLRAMKLAGLELAPGIAGEQLARDAVLRRAQEVLLLPHALDLMLGPLLSAGLEPLVFKGPALLDRYGETGLRPMDDVDILLPKRDHAVALDALTREGWTTVDTRSGDHYDTYLVHPDARELPLELHWELATWRDRSNRLRGDALWRERVPQSIGPVDAYGLPPAIELVALAAHAGKPFHHFNRLLWSVDIAFVVEAAGPSLDWDRVAALAQQASCEVVVAVALQHARRLGVTVPDEMTQIRGGHSQRLALVPVLNADWPFAQPDVGTVHRLRYALSDSVARQVGLVVGEVADTVPSEMPGRAVGVARRAFRRWRIDRARPSPDTEPDGEEPD